MSKPCIAFVTGGYSGEAVISYKSAVTIENNLDLSRYIVYRIDITPEQWFHPSASGESGSTEPPVKTANSRAILT